MVSHVISCYELPKAISSDIDSLIIRSWWAGSASKGIHRVKSSIVHLPKGLEGLGIRAIAMTNKSFLMKKACLSFLNLTICLVGFLILWILPF